MIPRGPQESPEVSLDTIAARPSGVPGFVVVLGRSLQAPWGVPELLCHVYYGNNDVEETSMGAHKDTKG